MHLSDAQLLTVKLLLRKLFSLPFRDSLVLDVLETVKGLTDSQYLAFTLFPTDEKTRDTLVFLSNNPPEFVPVYLSVVHQDYLMDHLLIDDREYLLSQDPFFEHPSHREFNHAVQSARPISDVFYLPLRRTFELCGYWAMARAGLTSPSFTEDQLALFRFLGDFLNDAFERSLRPFPVEIDMASLDYRGQVLEVGSRLQSRLERLWGIGPFQGPRALSRELERALAGPYRRFLLGPLRVGMDRSRFRIGNRDWIFRFQLLNPNPLSPRYRGVPYATVILESSPEATQEPWLALGSLSRRFDLTPREQEVVHGVLRGRSNKVIALDLGIDESTVKRHTHNIYEKTGFRSRVELVLGISRL